MTNHPHHEQRHQASQDFQASLNQLEERLLKADTPEDINKQAETSHIPLKTASRLPFHVNSTSSLSQEDFDLESLQEAVADIEQFIQERQ